MTFSAANISELGLDSYTTDNDLASVKLFKDFSPALLLFGSVCCVVFMVIGIPGNLITIVALAQYKKIRNATAIFIIHLHIADLVFCTLILPIVGVTFYSQHWITGKTMCRLYPMLKYMLSGVSLFTIVSIAINRYVMCCHPLLYPKIYKGRYISLMIIGIWLINFGLFAPSYYEILGRFSLNSNSGFCTIIRDKHDRSPKLALLIIAFVIPSLIMGFCYIRLIWFVRETTRNCRLSKVVPDSSTTSETSTDENTKRKSEQKTTLKESQPNKKDTRLRTMISIIMVTFFICRLPYLLTSILFDKSRMHPEACIIAYTLLHSIHCINPIIYVLMSKEYRKAYRHLFKTITNKCFR